MQKQLSFHSHLPSLRPDLEVFRGPDQVDGSPTYTVFDPVVNKYFKFNWAEALIMKYLQ